jgi:hypothetical protein
MSSKILSEVLSSLPILKKAQWLLSIQEQMQALVPANYKIKCSIKDDELVLLADNPAIARRLAMHLPNLTPVLAKYNLAMPKVIIIPPKS